MSYFSLAARSKPYMGNPIQEVTRKQNKKEVCFPSRVVLSVHHQSTLSGKNYEKLIMESKDI